jgi:ABC-2 type transport system ATP-binding protein
MSIVVRHVEKVFGTQHALRGVSLEVGRGEVVGLLGPNGAGKSTLMRLLTGYMPPTSGRVEVCGLDVVDHPLETKRRVGYLLALGHVRAGIVDVCGGAASFDRAKATCRTRD